MTVAAVILAPTGDLALADTLGQPRVRRLADIAWAGGALPVVVVAPDPDGAVARALAETEAVVADPGDGPDGAGARVLRGTEAAAAAVRDVSAALVWPATMSWVGAETVTSLIEAHGVEPGAVLRPAWDGRSGWPILVPFDRLGPLRSLPGVDADGLADALEAAGGVRALDLGDPGAVFDAATAEADLPPYEGPTVPAGGHVHEWGEDLAAAADADEVPGEGRALSPYPQAAPGGPTDT